LRTAAEVGVAEAVLVVDAVSVTMKLCHAALVADGQTVDDSVDRDP